MIWPILLAIGVAAWVGYTVALAQRVTAYRLAFEAEVSRSKAEDAKHNLANATEDDRLSVLESAVFGTAKPPEAPTVKTPVWLLNSVKQNSDRITALERWRLKTENGKVEDGR